MASHTLRYLGIWQTVWIEPVHEAYVEKYEVTSDIDRGTVTFRVASPVTSAQARVTVKEGDKVGTLVWQDMPNGKDAGMIGDKNDIHQNFYEECTRIVDALKQHPCIVSWVVYNEGWGQDAGADDIHTRRGVENVLRCDDTRLINPASGWTNFEMGDINDCHSYSSPGVHANPLNERVAVCGEYGGITLKVDGHIWKGSGMEYVSVNDNKELTKRFNELTLSTQQLQKDGIGGAVYIQITDVEVGISDGAYSSR